MSAWLFLLYPLIIGLIGYCGLRSAILAKGLYRWLAAAAGILLTAASTALAFGLFIGSGGV